MRIVRFLDENDNVCHGTDMKDDSAELLTGNILKNPERTGNKAKIKTLLSPVQPYAIICIGLNYRAHAAELGMDLPQNPVMFMKNTASATGHGSPVILPASCRAPLQVDYEAELAVVIGKKAKNVSESEAKEYVAGYTIANDVSARDWQFSAGGGQWIRGKSFDTFCPLGPELVTADELTDPDSLNIECFVNGEKRQGSNTSDMIFSVSQIIHYLSEDTTLMPGTVILTGTPYGIGYKRTPPVFLKPGDRMEVCIEKIGRLVNGVE